MKLIPIILFAFKRPNHTRQLLESLSKNSEAKDSELFVFIDGPNSCQDENKIEEVKDIVKSRNWCGRVHVSANSQNQRMPTQVITNVSRLCAEYGKVIVLEDDLVLSPFFLGYMNSALEYFENQEKVMEVSGYIYPIRSLSISTGFIRGSMGWGWGTWQRAWKHFESNGRKLLANLSDSKLRYEFDFCNSYRNYALLKDQVAGRVGGWDVRWAASIFLKGGLTLCPGKSLVQNIGSDGTGTNLRRSASFRVDLSTEPIRTFPDRIEESEEMLSAVMEFHRSQKNPIRSFTDWFKISFCK